MYDSYHVKYARTVHIEWHRLTSANQFVGTSNSLRGEYCQTTKSTIRMNRKKKKEQREIQTKQETKWFAWKCYPCFIFVFASIWRHVLCQRYISTLMESKRWRESIVWVCLCLCMFTPFVQYIQNVKQLTHFAYQFQFWNGNSRTVYDNVHLNFFLFCKKISRPKIDESTIQKLRASCE